MNIWDILILAVVTGWVLYTVIRLRKNRSANACSGCALRGNCSACMMKRNDS